MGPLEHEAGASKNACMESLGTVVGDHGVVLVDADLVNIFQTA